MNKGLCSAFIINSVACLAVTGCLSTSTPSSMADSSGRKTGAVPSAGASKVEMKLPADFFPYDSFNQRHYTGIHDPLYIRTLVFSYGGASALFISIDTGDISGEWLSEISSFSGVPQENIFLTATHTHESPYISRTLAENLSEPEKSAAFAQLAKKELFESITNAEKSSRPCTVGFNTGMCDVNVNRNVLTADGTYKTGVNPDGISDKTVSVVTFNGLDGTAIGYLYSYAIHSTVMLFSKVKDGGMLLSGDIAGAASRYVEKKSGNSAVALWLLAPCADQGPKKSATYPLVDKNGTTRWIDLGEKGFKLVDEQGDAIGKKVLAISKITKTKETDPVLQGIVQQITVDGIQNPISLRLNMMKMGDIVFFGFPGELVTSVGHAIQQVLAENSIENSIVITQCDGSNGYFSNDFGYDHKTFDGTASFAKKGYDKKVLDAEQSMIKQIN